MTSLRTLFLRRIAAALAIVFATLGVVASPAAAAYDENITIQGHGWGHGRGLGQYGSLSYALEGWSSGQILAHYYGNTTDGTIDPAAEIRVRLTDLDDKDTIVFNTKGLLVTSAAPGAFTALRAEPLADGSYNVYQGPGCEGPWTLVDGATVPPAAPFIDFSIAPKNDDSADVADLVGVCEPDGTQRWYRGQVLAVRDLEGRARTANSLRIDAYLRGVVPREMPASWGDLGGGRGMQALQAQTVAARSYAWSENRYSYAKTCDTASCQVYLGVAQIVPGGSLQVLEDARTTQAVNDTAGRIRLMSDGSPARTEFSSSTGGHTAGGVFPAVVDEGDDIASNKNHTWTTSIPRASVEQAYPTIGSLNLIDITKRNGLGDLGGRVLTVVVKGTKGSVTLTGNEFRSKFNLKSDWFRIASSFLDVPASAVATGAGQSYWVAARDGSVFNFNGAPYAGSMAGVRLNGGIVSMAPTPDGQGYWLVGSDGGVFTFNAPFYGSTGSLKINAPAVAMASRPQADGYWFVGADGGVYAFGNAPFLGSMGGVKLVQPMVGMASTASGNGYWLVAKDGGIFTFGDAGFFGSIGGKKLANPVIAMAARPQGDGYWMVGTDGKVYAFGGAKELGPAPALAAGASVVGISPSPTGNGYRLISTDGTSYAYGDAE